MVDQYTCLWSPCLTCSQQFHFLIIIVDILLRRYSYVHIIICYRCPTVISIVTIGQYQHIDVVPDSLVKALADIRIEFAHLKRDYHKALEASRKARKALVEFLPSLFPEKQELVNFDSWFDMLIEEEISLFNIHYLKRSCSELPKDVR